MTTGRRPTTDDRRPLTANGTRRGAIEGLRKQQAYAVLALGLLLLIAAFLRFYHIGVQSFWADEGNSVMMAPRALPDIIRRTANDIHPPLYYITLHAWVRLFGTSEAAARALSALFGVATVALTAALGRVVGGRRVALLAALAAAVSPFAIHYSQEARMYMMVTMLAAASWLAFARLQQTNTSSPSTVHRPPSSLPHYLLTLVMLYTHYYAVSVVVAQNLAWLLGTIRARRWERRWWARWIAVQVALLAAYLPWLWYARETILNWPAISPDIALPFFASELFRIFSFGLASDGLPLWPALGFGFLIITGIITAARTLFRSPSTVHRPPSTVLPLFIAAVPPLLMLFLSLDRPFWNPKFLLLALPGYHLLLAQGAVALLDRVKQWQPRLSAPLAALVVAFLLLAAAPPLHNEYWEPRFWRDDYRAIARTIAARATPDDAVLLDGPGQREIFDYYYGGDLPRYALPNTRPLDEAATIKELEAIAARHQRLFAVWWAEQEGDPTLLIPRWLEENAFEAGSRWFGNVRLAVYRLGDLPAPEPLDVTFTAPDTELTLRLRGANIEPETAIAGDIIAINSVWAAAGDVPVTFFAQLLDAGNHVVGQYDGSGGAPPVAQWQGEQAVRLGLPVAIGTPPGDYALIIGAYRTDNGQRLLTPEGDAYRLATVRVEKPVVPPTVDALALPQSELREVSFGGITLVGARANKLGFDHAPETPIAPGEPLSVLLYWQAAASAPAAPPLHLRLRGQRDTIVAEWPFEPTEGRYPLTNWDEGELVRDPQVRFLPAGLPPGSYRLSLEGDTPRALIGSIVIP
jgi:4-amino-4-deoxy-L-arabinose transferase-like glycosyltransferase